MCPAKPNSSVARSSVVNACRRPGSEMIDTTKPPEGPESVFDLKDGSRV
jgi:hypothetical protein